MTIRMARHLPHCDVCRCLLVLCFTGCVPEPQDHKQSASVQVASSPTLVSGVADACADVTVTLTQTPPSGQTVTLTTTIGVLSPGAATLADQRKVALTTAESKTLTTQLCPGSVPGAGYVTFSAPGIDPVQSAPVTVNPPSVNKLFLTATTVELHVPGHTTSTLQVQVFPARPQDDATTTRIGLLACCNLSAQDAGPSPIELCNDDVTVAPFVDIAGASTAPTTVTASLTVDGQTFASARTDGTIHERDVTVYAYLPNQSAPECSDLAQSAGTSDDPWKASSVVLRLTTRGVDSATTSN